MAVEKEVRILFEGVDRVSGVIENVGNRLDAFGGQVTSATQPLADLAASALRTELALAALAAGGLALAVVEAGRFNASFNEIASITDAPAEALNRFRDDILNYSTSSTQSIESINAAIYEAISSGIQWSQSLDFLTASERLSVAGKAELADSTRLLAAALNAYGADVSQVTDYSDALFQAVRVGVTTIPELANSLGQVIGVAAAANIPFTDLMGAISAITLAGVPTEQAITQIRSAITGIIAPSEQARTVAQQLGIQFDAQALQARGLQGYLGYLAEATGGNVETMFSLIGRVEGLNAALILGRDANGQYANSMQAMADRTGSTERAYQTMVDNFELINQRLINNLRAVAITIGGPLQDEYSQIANSLVSMFQGINIGIDRGAFDPLFQALESIGVDIAAFFRDIAAVMPDALAQLDFSRFLESIRNLGGEFQDLFRAFFGDIDLTTAEGLASAIQRIIDGVTALTNVTAGIIDAWGPFIRALSEGIDRFSQSSDGTQELAGNILGLGQAINTVASNFGILTSALSIIAGALSVLSGTHLISAIGGFGALTSSIGSAAGAAGGIAAVIGAIGLGAVADMLLSRLVPGWEANRQAMADNIATLDGASDATGEWIGASEQAEETLQRQSDIWQELSDAMDALPESVETQVSAPGAELTQQEIEDIQRAFAEIGEEKTITVETQADEGSITRVRDIIIRELPDGRTILTQAQVDQPSVDRARDTVNRELPSEKIMEIRLQGEIQTEIARINAQAETLQTAFEWQARVDIAEVEQVFETIRSQSENITEMFANTGDVLSALAASLGDISGISRLEIFELMEEESRRRDALLLEQQRLTAAQIEYLRARTNAMQQGQGLLTINAEGIQPELELVLRRIIELAQIRANEEGLNFLLGVT